MNKLTKLLSVFAIAGVLSAGAAVGLAGCGNKHEHEADSAWHTNETQHWHECTANDGEKMNAADHVDANNDGKCDVCDYQIATVNEDYVVPDGVTGLTIEGVTEEVTLSSTKTSHTIDKTAIKVYLKLGATKGSEVPAANYELKLYKNGTDEVTEWANIKDDASFVIVATLKDAKKADGTAVSKEGEITVTINNPVTAVALKTGTVTQVQNSVNSMTDWTYEATRANGDKFDVAASNITVGTLDTVTVGEHTVDITYGDVHGSVTYTITADQSKVSQSYAMNFGNLSTEQIAAIKNGDAVSLQEGRFVVQSTTGGEVASHGKTYSNKYFVNRLKTNGASTAKGAPRYIKVHADGAGTITVIAYNNSSDATRSVELYSGRTEDAAAGDTYTGQVGTTVAIPAKDHATATYTITAAGDYYITCTGAMTYCYVQLDQLVDGGEGVTKVELGGTNVASKIEVEKPANVNNFKVNAAFNHDGYTVKATAVNDVTCDSGTVDVTADATFTAPDMTTIGEKEVTVTYAGCTDTYKIIVETAVDGIYGATASTALNTQVSSAEGTVTVKKSDITVSLLGTNAEATTSYVVKNGDTEITDGTALGVGEYTLTVTVTVTAGAQSDVITCTLPIKVEVQAAVGATQSFIVSDTEVTGDAKTISAGSAIADNTLFNVKASADMNYNIGKDATAGVGNTNKAVTVTLQDGSSKTFKQGISTTTDTTKGGTSSDIVITAKTKQTLRIYVTYCNNSYNSNRSATINYTVSGGTAATPVAKTTSVSDRTAIAVIEVTLEEGQTLTINASGTDNTGRLWLFGVEGKAVA